MSALLQYAWDVVWGWQGLILGLFGLNELSNWLTGKSLKWVHRYRWQVAAIGIIFAQGLVYRDLATSRSAAAAQATPSPVLAENPDHATLAKKLDDANSQIKSLETELTTERNARVVAEQRAQALAAQRSTEAQRTNRCTTLASLSGTGRQLVDKLFQTRAATGTRREIDQWYGDVCKAMSAAQCEAFRGAPRKADRWNNYPFDDDGYSQTLRGRAEYVANLVGTTCR